MTVLFTLYASLLFVALTLIGVLVFFAINKVSHAQWANSLYPIMQSVTAPLGAVLLALLGLLFAIHQEAYFLLRSAAYMAIPIGFRYLPALKDKRALNIVFLLLFFLAETPMAWDWLLSLTPHWHSTLFAWYVLSSFLLSGIALTTLFCKKEHYSDVGKYLFGFSLFWAYLWYSQYMLIWYANIPEETIYYQTLLSKGYGSVVIAMLILSFGIPFVTLLSSRAKRKKELLFGAAALVLIGQYLNFLLMVLPFSK